VVFLFVLNLRFEQLSSSQKPTLPSSAANEGKRNTSRGKGEGERPIWFVQGGRHTNTKKKEKKRKETARNAKNNKKGECMLAFV